MSELQGLQLKIAEFEQRGAAVVALVVDPVERNAQVVARFGLGFPILSDPELTVIDAYGLRHEAAVPGLDVARPATFLVDATGVVRWRDLTDNYRKRPRPAAILAAIDALARPLP